MSKKISLFASAKGYSVCACELVDGNKNKILFWEHFKDNSLVESRLRIAIAFRGEDTKIHLNTSPASVQLLSRIKKFGLKTWMEELPNYENIFKLAAAVADNKIIFNSEGSEIITKTNIKSASRYRKITPDLGSLILACNLDRKGDWEDIHKIAT